MELSQLAVGNYAHSLFSFDYFLNMTDQLPVRKLELWAAGPHLYLDDYTRPMLEDIRRKIVNHGLELVCLTPEQCMYPINIGAADRITRERSLRYFRKAIDASAILESPKTLVTVGQSLRDQDRDIAFRLTADAIGELADYAVPKGIEIVVEHLTKTTTNVAVTAVELKAVLDAAGRRPNLRPMLDTDMAARVDEEPADYLRVFGSLLGHVHLVDGLPGGHLVPGDGILPVERYLRQLDAFGYQGCITLEVANERYALDPNDALRRSVRFFEKYVMQGEKKMLHKEL